MISRFFRVLSYHAQNHRKRSLQRSRPNTELAGAKIWRILTTWWWRTSTLVLTTLDFHQTVCLSNNREFSINQGLSTSKYSFSITKWPKPFRFSAPASCVLALERWNNHFWWFYMTFFCTQKKLQIMQLRTFFGETLMYVWCDVGCRFRDSTSANTTWHCDRL